jgi:hypothetical protein
MRIEQLIHSLVLTFCIFAIGAVLTLISIFG